MGKYPPKFTFTSHNRRHANSNQQRRHQQVQDCRQAAARHIELTPLPCREIRVLHQMGVRTLLTTDAIFPKLQVLIYEGVRVQASAQRHCHCVASTCTGWQPHGFSEGKGSTSASALQWLFARTAAGAETRCEEGWKAAATGATRSADHSHCGQSRSNHDGEGWVRPLILSNSSAKLDLRTSRGECRGAPADEAHPCRAGAETSPSTTRPHVPPPRTSLEGSSQDPAPRPQCPMCVLSPLSEALKL